MRIQLHKIMPFAEMVSDSYVKISPFASSSTKDEEDAKDVIQ